MRKLLLVFSLLFFVSTFSNAQRRDNIWMLGFNCQPYVYPAITFNSGQVDTFSVTRTFGFFITNSSICDTSGNLLFYTNGVKIANANHDTLFNSLNYNPGYASTINCENLNIPQGTLIIPQPNSDSLYYLFHESGENFTYNGFPQQQPLNLKYSIIDMSLANGLGGIIPSKKGIVLVNDTMTSGWMTACKHGNGRDWWLIAPRFSSNQYYKALLTADTLDIITSQIIGDSINYDNLGQAVFSPDGSIYANVDVTNKLNIFRYDRCTGLFYDSTFIQVPNPNMSVNNQTYSVAFSSNSRFLYVVLYTKIIQYDMWSGNISSSGTYVAQWDTANLPFPTRFMNAQLAPDNKIYIGTYGGTYVLHYIDQPDSQGLACNVVQNMFFISNNSIGNDAVPIFPNYDLGPLIGSPCDTITGVSSSEYQDLREEIKISPNPASSFIYVNYKIAPNQTAQFILYDSFGRIAEKKNLYGTFRSLLVHTNQLSNGIYYWSVEEGKKKIASGKLVVIH